MKGASVLSLFLPIIEKATERSLGHFFHYETLDTFSGQSLQNIYYHFQLISLVQTI